MTDDTGATRPSPDELLAFVKTMGSGGLPEKMGIVLTEVSYDRLVGTMPVDGNTQPYGILHGGAHAVLAASLGSIGAASHAGPDRIVMGIEISCSHHRAATTGTVTGTAIPITTGRTVSTWEIVMTDDAGRRLSTSRLTCIVRDRPS